MSSLNWTYICLLGLLPTACSLGDFDSLGAGDPDQNVGGSAGTAGSGGTAGRGGSGGTGGTGVTGGTGGSAGSAGTAGTGGTSGAPTNIIINPSFEAGTAWARLGNCTVERIADDDARTGNYCLLTTNRTQLWEGPSFSMTSRGAAGQSYLVSLWVRNHAGDSVLDAGVTYDAQITVKWVCNGVTTFDNYTRVTVTNDWTEMAATFTYPDCAGNLTEVSVYVDDAPVGANYCIDDTSITLAQ